MTDIADTQRASAGVMLRADWIGVLYILFVVAFIGLAFAGYGKSAPGDGNAVLSIAPKAHIMAPLIWIGNWQLRG
jgi:Na+/proline symporter